MDYSLSICQRVVIFFSCLLVFISPQILALSSQCVSSNLALDKATSLYNRDQFLLSAQEFSMAEKFDCTVNREKAKWGYLLALTELGEKNETFYLSTELYPVQMTSLEYKKKLEVYQAYHFSIHKDEVITKRVDEYNKWIDGLPQPKSPLLAGTMSAVLPGAGQIYVGSWQSGIMAFVLNALFLSATLELEDKNLNSTALASGVVFSIAYLGNILNAAESARVYNQNFNREKQKNEFKQKLPELNL